VLAPNLSAQSPEQSESSEPRVRVRDDDELHNNDGAEAACLPAKTEARAFIPTCCRLLLLCTSMLCLLCSFVSESLLTCNSSEPRVRVRDDDELHNNDGAEAACLPAKTEGGSL
jgi:hypothetical protein